MKVCSHDYNISCKRIAPPRKRIKTQTVISQQAVGTTIYWRQCSNSPLRRVFSLSAWLLRMRPERPREAQRSPQRRSVDRTSLSCAWLEDPHKKIYDQGGSPLLRSPGDLASLYSWSIDQEPFGVLFSGFGALQKSGFPICELLIKLATFWLGATRSLFGGLFSGFGALQKSAFPMCELLIKLATFWQEAFWAPFFGIWGPSKKRLANM